MSHSKRNTSRAVFTSYERSLAKAAWTTSSARLSRDSFLPFASCSLCLEPAQDPVACPMGDIFCRECALNNILSQKKEMRRLEKTRAQEERDRAERQIREDAEAQARAVQEFELVQSGLERKGKKVEAATPTPVTMTGTPNVAAGTPDEPSKKRKFTLDEDELKRVAEEDRSKARRAIEADRAAAHDARALPSFWTPSETPNSDRKDSLPEAKGSESGSRATITDGSRSASTASSHPMCPASRDSHTYSLHTLVSVKFETDSKGQRTCPACNKMLSNSSKAVLAKPCGHVLCRSCVHQFVKPPGANGQAALFDPHAPPGTTGTVRCYVCEADLEETTTKDKKDSKKDGKKDKDKKKDRVKPGLVDLRSEGTGFSAGGAREVKKNGVAFQC